MNREMKIFLVLLTIENVILSLMKMGKKKLLER